MTFERIYWMLKDVRSFMRLQRVLSVTQDARRFLFLLLYNFFCTLFKRNIHCIFLKKTVLYFSEKKTVALENAGKFVINGFNNKFVIKQIKCHEIIITFLSLYGIKLSLNEIYFWHLEMSQAQINIPSGPQNYLSTRT